MGVTALDALGFLDSLQKTSVGTTGGLELVSPGDRLLIAASDMNIAFKPAAEEGVHKLHNQAMQGFRGVGIEVNGRGIEELTAIATVASSGWFVVAHLQTVEAFALVTRLQNFMLSNAAGVTMVFLLTMVIFHRYLLRPLKNAAQHADRMTRGEIPLEMQVAVMLLDLDGFKAIIEHYVIHDVPNPS